jgi:hypothetical protein
MSPRAGIDAGFSPLRPGLAAAIRGSGPAGNPPWLHLEILQAVVFNAANPAMAALASKARTPPVAGAKEIIPIALAFDAMPWMFSIEFGITGLSG